MAKKISITLTSYNIGDESEAVFDAWANYVANHVEGALSLPEGSTDVDQQAYGEAGKDRVSGADDDQREAILNWLAHEGWEDFCGRPDLWPKAAE